LSRAAKLGLPTTELAVGYRKRIGISKISGTIAGVFGAGTKILFIIAREAFGDFGKSNRAASACEQAGNRSIDKCVA
jgi:predicted ThiF/HesA family dinucleotide-utilizing enzyme